MNQTILARPPTACPHCGNPVVTPPDRQTLVQIKGEARAIIGRIDKLLGSPPLDRT